MYTKTISATAGLIVLLSPFVVVASGIRTLSLGMSGADVLTLQKKLIVQGLLSSDSATGYFGKLTRAAVQSFQSQNGIVGSGDESSTGYGSVGPRTRAALASGKMMEIRSLLSVSSSTPPEDQDALIVSLRATIAALTKQLAELLAARSQVPATQTVPPATVDQGTNTTTQPAATEPTTTGTSTSVATSVANTTEQTTTTTSNQPCTFNNQSVAHGNSITAWQSPTVPYGAQCVSEQRTCSNGTLGGSYNNATCSVQSLDVSSTSVPIFEDLFTETSLNTASWNAAHLYSGNATHQDLAEYIPEAITTGSGGLAITATKQSAVDPATGATLQFTSGRIQGKRSFLYGKFEWRAKLPAGRGLWPALWLRTQFGQPFNGEIDMVEGHGSNPNVIQSTLHPWVNGVENTYYCTFLFAQGAGSSQLPCLTADPINLPTNFSDGFHTYAVDWEPTFVTWYIDGKPYFTETRGVPHDPMVVVIELNVSAGWDGQPDWTGSRQLLISSMRVYPPVMATTTATAASQSPQPQPPTAPVIYGPTAGTTGTPYAFSFTSTDPADQAVHYAVDWNNDGSTDLWVPWSAGFIPSGTVATAHHAWTVAGAQTFRVRAQNSGVIYSPWSSYTITVENPSADLTASVPSIVSGTLVAGDPITFEATVMNKGPGPVSGNFFNRFWIDLNADYSKDLDLIASLPTPDIAPGKSKTVTSSLWSAVAGTHRMGFCTDQNASKVGTITEIDDSDVSNCGTTFFFTVKPTR